MASLTNQKISNSYLGLLNTTSNGVLTSSLAQITDGNGNGSPIYLSTAALNLYNKYTFPDAVPASGTFLKATDGVGTLAWVAESGGDVKKTGTITINTIAVWNDATETLRSDPVMSIVSNSISLLQKNSSNTDTTSYNIGGGNIANVTGLNNVGFGQSNMQSVTTGTNNTAFGTNAIGALTIGSGNTGMGKASLFDCNEGDNNTGVGLNSLTSVTTGDDNTALGMEAGQAVTTGSSNTFIGKDAGRATTGSSNTFLGNDAGTSVSSGSKNVIIGSNNGGTIATSSNNIIIADGDGNERIQVDSVGKVGVGVTIPIVPFHISGTAVSNPSNGTGAYEVMQVLDNTSAAQNVGAGIGLGGNFTGTTPTIFSEIRGRKENSTDSNYASALTFSTRENGQSIDERLRISSSGVLTMTVASGSNPRLAFAGASVSGTHFIQVDRSNSSMEFYVNGDTRAEISSTGNIGINTTPVSSRKVVIKGDGNSGTTNASFLVVDSSNADKFIIYDNGLTVVNNVLNVLGNGSSYATHEFTTQNANVAKYIMRDASGVTINQFSADAAAMNFLGSSAFGVFTQSPNDVNGTNISADGNIQIYSNNNNANLIANGGAAGTLLLNDRGASVNSRLWRVKSDGGVFSINAMNDAISAKHNTLEISEGGTVAIYGAASNSHQFLIHGFDNGANFNTFSQNLSGQELFGVRNNGEFQTGQATDSPANNSTTGSGNCFINSAGTLVTTSSSKKFKNTITDATHGLSDVLKLRSVTYKSNNTKIDGDKTFGGFIAEEVDDLGLTEFVHYDDNDEPKSLHYANMVSLLTKAIQEQQTIIDDLKSRIEKLEK